MRKRVPWLSILVFVAILYLTLSPSPLPPPLIPTFNGWDKLAHFVMFGAWTAVIVYEISKIKGRLSVATIAWIIAGVAAISGAIELLQGTEWVNRACDFSDFIANSLGAIVLGSACGYIMRRK